MFFDDVTKLQQRFTVIVTGPCSGAAPRILRVGEPYGSVAALIQALRERILAHVAQG